ncbi:MAG: MATE family efflux transporter [Clostridia bacterium]|nr:MATE family efflux transporter [Clostridia bacterium]
MIKFAIPSVISLVVTQLYNIVDQIFIGNGVGYLGNGATNVVFPITVIAYGLAMLLGCACAAFLNLRLGEGKQKDAEKGVGNSLTLLVALAVILPALCYCFVTPLVRLFGATDTILPYALDYGKIIILGFPFVILYTGLNQIIRADGSPKLAMVSMLSGAVLNVILDYIFIFPLQMGVKGTAIATVVGQAVSLIIALFGIFRLKHVRLTKECFLPDGKIIAGVCSIGASSFIVQAAIVLFTAVMNNVLVKYGALTKYGSDIPIAAMGIVMKVNAIIINVIVGISIGGQPLISYSYGAKNYQRVKQAFKTVLLSCVAVGILVFVLVEFFPAQVLGLFGDEGGLYTEFAVKCFRILLCLCILNAAQQCSGIFMQSIGKPGVSMFLSLTRQVIFLIPAVLLMSYFFGLEGALWACPVADAVAFAVAAVFMVREIRKMKQVDGAV